VDERRMRGLLFRGENAELDVGVNGSVPVKSGDNRARRGMPDLDGVLEIGPSLNILLARGANRKLDLRLPVRKAIASDFSHLRHVGWIFQPTLNLDLREAFGNAGWNLGLQASVLFTGRRYNEYFYSVDPAFATSERPAYSAGGGYAGTQFIAALSKRYPKFWIGGFAKWDRLTGTAFENSPLVKDKTSFAAGFAVAWILGDSKTRVETRE
jgi:outer membrane protein